MSCTTPSRSGTAAVVHLIASGVAIDEIDFEGSPLQIAVMRGNADIVDARNKTGKTTLAGAQGPVVDYLRGLGMAQ